MYHTFRLQSFQPYLAQYGKLASTLAGTQLVTAPKAITGRLIVIDRRVPDEPTNLAHSSAALQAFDPSAWEFHDFYFDLPSDLRATSPSEVGSILVLNCETSRTIARVHYYQGNKEVFNDAQNVETCEGDVIDVLSSKMTGKLYGSDGRGSRNGILMEIIRLDRR